MTVLDRLRLSVLGWQLACTFNFALFSGLFIYWDVDYHAQLFLWLAYVMFTATHGIVYVLFYCTLKGVEE